MMNEFISGTGTTDQRSKLSPGLSTATTLFTFFLLVLLLVKPWPLGAQDVDQAELKERFFEAISADQAIKLLTTIDRSDQLTSVELGAKYKWGYIPPDRTPPFSLAQWWDDLNARERRRVRLNWFDEHYHELNVERAARELEMRDRLTKLYRELSQDETDEAVQFEPVSFPDDSLDVDTGEKTALPESYRKYQTSTEAEAVDRTTEPGSAGTSPDGNSSKSEPASASTGEKPGKATGDHVAPPSDEGADTTAAESKDPDWRESLELEQGTVIFERTGNKINVIKRNQTTDTHLRNGPDYKVPIRPARPGVSDEVSPPLRYDRNGVSPAIR